MIDFINPKSKLSKTSWLLSLVGLVVIIAGGLLLYSNGREIQQAKAIAGYEYLPSGDSVISDLSMADLLELYEQDENSAASTKTTESQPVETTSPSETIVTESSAPVATAEPAPVVKTNTLVIPRMGVDGTVYEGSDESTLAKGLWRMPMTSDDPTSGNMVITAHRYLRRPPNPNTFFLIDKVQVGDSFTLYWQGQEYNYIVRETKIVEPDDLSILYNTSRAQLTIFSCTPLFTSDKRLVVIADLVS